MADEVESAFASQRWVGVGPAGYADPEANGDDAFAYQSEDAGRGSYGGQAVGITEAAGGGRRSRPPGGWSTGASPFRGPVGRHPYSHRHPTIRLGRSRGAVRTCDRWTFLWPKRLVDSTFCPKFTLLPQGWGFRATRQHLVTVFTWTGSQQDL